MIHGIPKNTEFRQLFVELVKLFQPDTYVELGVKNGYMFNTIAPLVKTAIAIDTKANDRVVANDNAVRLWTTTNDAFEILKKNNIKIDFLFIDACHEKSQVLLDFMNYSKLVKEGTGLIFLHDTHPINEALLAEGYCHNANEAAWHIRTQFREDFEVVTLPGPFFGLSIIRKSRKQLAWR